LLFAWGLFYSAKLHFCGEKNKQMRSFAMKKGATRAVAPFIVVLPKPN